MTDEIHKLTLQINAPGRKFPNGKIETGYWVVADQQVVLCDEHGKPIDGEKRSIGPGGDPHLIAVAMMKARSRNNARPRGFNDPIRYPRGF